MEQDANMRPKNNKKPGDLGRKGLPSDKKRALLRGMREKRKEKKEKLRGKGEEKGKRGAAPPDGIMKSKHYSRDLDCSFSTADICLTYGLLIILSVTGSKAFVSWDSSFTV